MSFDEHLARRLELIQSALDSAIPEPCPQDDILIRSMRYSLLSGGKRIRPVLTLEFCSVCGGDEQQALPLACAVEMVHAYSLIHDDLPCMDNSDMRRSMPTNHMIFGESIALLAGDALLTAAFETAANTRKSLGAEKAALAVMTLARAAGYRGMVSGQVLDLLGEKRRLSARELELMHAKKTGALIEAACVLGVIAAGGTQKEHRLAREYARSLGLAFQIRDDMLDEEGSSSVLGKPAGSDAENSKSTFASLLGLRECARLVAEYSEAAISTAGQLEHGEFLAWLAGELSSRAK